MTYQLGDEPPVCSGPGHRQTSGSLHPQRSKARGDTVPSDALLLQQAENMTTGILSLCWSPGRTQAPSLADWQTNRLCAQVLGAGRPLAVCTPRDLKLGVMQHLVTLFCSSRQRIWLQEFSPSAGRQAGHRPHARWTGRQTAYVLSSWVQADPWWFAPPEI